MLITVRRDTESAFSAVYCDKSEASAFIAAIKGTTLSICMAGCVSVFVLYSCLCIVCAQTCIFTVHD